MYLVGYNLACPDKDNIIHILSMNVSRQAKPLGWGGLDISISIHLLLL